MWFWLALASAFFGALDIIINKKALHKVSPALLAWSAFALSIPPLIYFSFKEGIPNLNLVFLIGVFGSSLAFVFAKTIFNSALKKNLISKILPLTAFSGIFTYVFGLIFLSESIRPIPVLGLLSIIFGSYILNVDQAREDITKPFKLLFLRKESALFLLAVLLGSLTSILDKAAINNTAPASPVFTLLIEQIIMSVIMYGYLIKKENKTWFKELKNNFWMLSLNSLSFLIVGLLVMNAYSHGGPVALVVGVKRLQIFFVLLMGYLFFKDKPTKLVWLATAIMILGVLMIKLG